MNMSEFTKALYDMLKQEQYVSISANSLLKVVESIGTEVEKLVEDANKIDLIDGMYPKEKVDKLVSIYRCKGAIDFISKLVSDVHE